MAITLSQNAQLLLDQTVIEQQLILEIDGITTIFGAVEISELIRIGDEIEIGSFIIGGTQPVSDSYNYIDLSGSTSTIRQQIEITKGGQGSVSSYKVKLIDKNESLTSLFQSGNVVSDMLGRECQVYLSFASGGTHPEDSMRIFNGTISAIDAGAGFIDLTISHPEELKRQSIYNQIATALIDIDTSLNGAIDSSQTTISIIDSTNLSGLDSYSPLYVKIEDEIIQVGSISGNDLTGCTRGAQGSTAATHVDASSVEYYLGTDSTAIRLETVNGIVEPVDICKSYVRINDEIIQFSAISGNDLTGITRAQLSSSNAGHDPISDVVTIYRFDSDPIDIALKLMVSGSGAFVSGQSVKRFVSIDGSTNVSNALVVEESGFDDRQGIVEGDLVTITGATEASNNVTDAEILDIYQGTLGTVFVLTGVSLVSETDSGAVVSITSKYDTLNEGAAMNPRFVDVSKHEEINDLLSSQFPNYELLAEDTIELKDFLSKEVYFPAGLYQLPRGGRASVAATIPPLTLGQTKYLNESTVLNATSLKPTRSINKNFFNAIVYKYGRDIIADKFTRGTVTTSERSVTRIPVGNKSLTIESNGLKKDAATANFIRIQSRRFLDRFQFAGQQIIVETNYKTGVTIDIGDPVFFGGNGLNVSDDTNGTRDFEPRIFEVINKELNIKNGRIKLTILDVKSGLDGRFGVISPSSKLDSGSTTTEIILKPSFTTNLASNEREKWENFVGLDVLIHSEDYSFSETKRIIQLSTSNQYALVLDSALSSPPPEDYIVDVSNYPDNADTSDQATFKDQFCFWNPQVAVVSGTATTVNVDAGDIGKFFVGGFCFIHSDDYSNKSSVLADDPDLEIIDITSNTITFDRNIGFTPSSGDKIELIGFKDEGLPYRIF